MPKRAINKSIKLIFMKNNQDYQNKMDAIKTIQDEEVQIPNRPVDVYLQETENLYHWSLDDAPKLNVVGISDEMIKDLPLRTGACREAQSIWNKDYRSQKKAQKEWKILSREAYELRDNLMDTLRYAFRKDTTLMVQ